MEQHKNGHVFKAKDIDRIIAAHGKPPPQEIRQKLQDLLQKNRDQYIERQKVNKAKHLKSNEQARKRGRGR